MSGSTSKVTPEQRSALVERHRYINVGHDDWYDCVYSGFKEDMKAVGIDVKQMYFSGFCSQGDGACFIGNLDNAQTYLDHHHKDQYPMIRKLIEAGGGVYVSCNHSGRYYHENCTSFWVDSDCLHGVLPAPTEFHDQIVAQWAKQMANEIDDFEEDVIEQWRSYMQDLYRKLEAEYDHLTSDEVVWETIEANEEDLDEAA
jgi:hypothetical protein